MLCVTGARSVEVFELVLTYSVPGCDGSGGTTGSFDLGTEFVERSSGDSRGLMTTVVSAWVFMDAALVIGTSG